MQNLRNNLEIEKHMRNTTHLAESAAPIRVTTVCDRPVDGDMSRLPLMCSKPDLLFDLRVTGFAVASVEPPASAGPARAIVAP